MNVTKPISLLLVDDHELVRKGIACLLRNEPDMEIIGELSSGEAALEFVGRCRPDVILMDARMPGIGGTETTRRLLSDYPGLRIVAFSSISSGVVPSQMLRVGAMGFITKNAAVEEMLKAIRMVHRGQHYVTPEVATQLAVSPFHQNDSNPFEYLSRREMQIAQMLVDGRTISQIASCLDLSPKTIYSYRYRIFEKLGIRSDVDMTILAVKYGLTDDGRELEKFFEISRAG